MSCSPAHRRRRLPSRIHLAAAVVCATLHVHRPRAAADRGRDAVGTWPVATPGRRCTSSSAARAGACPLDLPVMAMEWVGSLGGQPFNASTFMALQATDIVRQRAVGVTGQIKLAQLAEMSGVEVHGGDPHVVLAIHNDPLGARRGAAGRRTAGSLIASSPAPSARGPGTGHCPGAGSATRLGAVECHTERCVEIMQPHGATLMEGLSAPTL